MSATVRRKTLPPLLLPDESSFSAQRVEIRVQPEDVGSGGEGGGQVGWVLRCPLLPVDWSWFPKGGQELVGQIQQGLLQPDGIGPPPPEG